MSPHHYPTLAKLRVVITARMNELGNWVWCGTLQVAQRETPLQGEDLGEPAGVCQPENVGQKLTKNVLHACLDTMR